MRRVRRPPLFQSLFSWNLLLMRGAALYPPQEGVVSILVFVELALDDNGGGNIDKKLLVFQSLFSWNLLLMFEGDDPCDPPNCFNPCFRGTCS